MYLSKIFNASPAPCCSLPAYAVVYDYILRVASTCSHSFTLLHGLQSQFRSQAASEQEVIGVTTSELSLLVQIRCPMYPATLYLCSNPWWDRLELPRLQVSGAPDAMFYEHRCQTTSTMRLMS